MQHENGYKHKPNHAQVVSKHLGTTSHHLMGKKKLSIQLFTTILTVVQVS